MPLAPPAASADPRAATPRPARQKPRALRRSAPRRHWPRSRRRRPRPGRPPPPHSWPAPRGAVSGEGCRSGGAVMAPAGRDRQRRGVRWRGRDVRRVLPGPRAECGPRRHPDRRGRGPGMPHAPLPAARSRWGPGDPERLRGMLGPPRPTPRGCPARWHGTGGRSPGRRGHRPPRAGTRSARTAGMGRVVPSRPTARRRSRPSTTARRPGGPAPACSALTPRPAEGRPPVWPTRSLRRCRPGTVGPC